MFTFHQLVAVTLAMTPLFVSAHLDEKRVMLKAKESVLPLQQIEKAGIRVRDEGTQTLFQYESPEGREETTRWEPSTLVHVIVSASVSREEDGGYSYEYILENDKMAVQSVAMFLVAAEGPVIRQISRTDAWGSQLSPKVVEGEEVHFWWPSASQGGENLSPGETLAGLYLLSPATPTFVRCWAKGDGLGLSSTGEVPVEIEQALAGRRGLFDDAVTGLTVGPGPTIASVSTLHEYLDSCLAQGWISQPAPYTGLGAVLNRAEAAEAAGDVQALCSVLLELQSAVMELASADPPQITSETQALLGLNAEYLYNELVREASSSEETGDNP